MLGQFPDQFFDRQGDMFRAATGGLTGSLVTAAEKANDGMRARRDILNIPEADPPRLVQCLGQ